MRVLGKKKDPSLEPKVQTLSSKNDEVLAYLNAITSISIFTLDGRELRTTIQKVDEVLLREKLRRKRAR